MSVVPTRGVVLLDCDGVLADFTGYVLRIIRDEFGREYGPEDVTEWDFGNLLETDAEKRVLWSELKAIGVANTLDELVDPDGVGPRAAVAAIRERGCRIYCVTSPMPGSPAWAWERICWLEEVAGIHRREVVIASDKTPVCGDFLVDDNLDNIRGWVEARRGRGLLWDRAYNRGHAIDGARVRRWADVFAELDAVTK